MPKNETYMPKKLVSPWGNPPWGNPPWGNPPWGKPPWGISHGGIPSPMGDTPMGETPKLNNAKSQNPVNAKFCVNCAPVNLTLTRVKGVNAVNVFRSVNFRGPEYMTRRNLCVPLLYVTLGIIIFPRHPPGWISKKASPRSFPWGPA